MQRIIVTTTDDAQSFSVQRGLVRLSVPLPESKRPQTKSESGFRISDDRP